MLGAGVVFRVLGPLEIIGPAGPVSIGSARQRAVLAVLLLHAGEIVSRDRLIDEVWGEDPPMRAEHALEVHVSALRAKLGRGLIEHVSGGYRLSRDAAPADLGELARLRRDADHALGQGDFGRAADSLRLALALYRGAPLEDVASTGVAAGERAELEAQQDVVLDDWLDASLGAGRHAQLVPELRRSVVEHPLREGLYERLALALYRTGRQAEALEVCRAARRRLDDELGVDPGPSLQALEVAILNHDRGLLPSPGATDTDRPPATSQTRMNLPLRLTSFVGRESEVAEVARALETSRLVALTGAGGVGKTSLAIEVARHAGVEYPDGVWFVPLASVTDGGGMAEEMAVAMGFRDTTARPAVERLLENIRERSLLLVLDNLEQIAGAREIIGELLEHAPGIKALVTTRVPLQLALERTFPVQPLALPAQDQPSAEAIASVPSVQLLLDRVRFVDPSFAVSTENAGILGELVRRLDGLPLAIELIAAQLAYLGPAEILERLGRHLKMIGPGVRGRTDRQRTVRASIEWSYALLAASPQTLLSQLGVFAGGTRLAELIEVAGAAVDEPVEEALSALIDHSLVTRSRVGDAVRIGMLETIHSFARERLDESGAGRATEQRHAVAFLALAERLAPRLPGRGQAAVLERLAEDRDNLRAAVRWAISAGEPELAQRLASALWRFWQFRGAVHEGQATVADILSMPGGDAVTTWRGRALEAAGGLAYWAGDYEAATAHYDEMRRVAENSRDERLLADAAFNRVFPYTTERTDVREGLAVLAEAVARHEVLGDEVALARLGWVRAVFLTREGRAEESQQLLEETYERLVKHDDIYYQGVVAGYLGNAALQRGDLRGVLRWSPIWVRISLELEDVAMLVRLMDQAPDVLLQIGRPRDAAVLAGAHQVLAPQYGIGSIRHLTAAPGDIVDRAGGIIGDERVRGALEEGRSMDLRKAVDFLLSVLDDLESSMGAA